MEISNFIIKNLANPHELERMFRKDPEAFRNSFSHAWELQPDSQVLAIWFERLSFKESKNTEKSSLFQKDFISMGILAILAGLVSRLIFQFAEQQSIAHMNLIFGIVPFVAAYFMYNNFPRKRIVYILAALFIISAIYLNMLPLEQNDSIILAYIHLPIFLWVLVGLAFTGNEFGKGSTRLAYLKFNGAGKIHSWIVISSYPSAVYSLLY